MTALAFALLATLPFAAAGWLTALTTDRLAVTPWVRERVWALAFWGPVAAAAAIPLLAPLIPSAAIVPQGWGSDTTPRAMSMAPIMLLGAAILGAAIKLGGLALSYRRLARIAAAADPVGNAALASALDGHAARLHTRRPALLRSDAVATPMIIGLWRPVILFPSQLTAAATDRLALVGAHELAHLKRGDNLRVLAEVLALSLLWFNPFLPLIASRLTAAREEARDVLALAGASPTARHDYAEILLDTLRLGASSKQHPAFIGAGRKHTAMRLRSILHPAPPSPARLLAGGAGALTIVAGLGLASVAIAAQLGPVRVQTDYIAVHDVRISQGDATTPARLSSGSSVMGTVRYTVNGELMPQDFNPEPLLFAPGAKGDLKGAMKQTPQGMAIVFDLKTP